MKPAASEGIGSLLESSYLPPRSVQTTRMGEEKFCSSVSRVGKYKTNLEDVPSVPTAICIFADLQTTMEFKFYFLCYWKTFL